MATNLQIDDKLLIQAVKVGGHKTKKSAVTEALQEYIQHHEQKKIIQLFSVIEYDSSFDYKTQRKRK